MSVPIVNLVRSAYRSNLISISAGIIGFSSSEGTLQRLSLQATLLRSNIKIDLDIKKGSKEPKDLQKSRMKYDEDMVSKFCDLLKQWPPMFGNFTCIA